MARNPTYQPESLTDFFKEHIEQPGVYESIVEAGKRIFQTARKEAEKVAHSLRTRIYSF